MVRAGYLRSFSRPAIGDFTAVFNTNPGITIPVTRNAQNGLLVGSGPVPVLLRDTSRLGPAPFNATPTYPILPTTSTTSLAGFTPNTKIPYADTFQAGITRSLGKSMALEVRYVGSRGHEDWGLVDFNEQNVTTNGFLNEFRLAQANLKANIASGKGATFAYTGAGHQPAADLPRLLHRAVGGERGQSRGLHRQWRRELPEHDVCRVPRAAQPAAVQLRVVQRHQRSAGQLDVPGQRARGRSAGELLRRQSRHPREPRRSAPT